MVGGRGGIRCAKSAVPGSGGGRTWRRRRQELCHRRHAVCGCLRDPGLQQRPQRAKPGPGRPHSSRRSPTAALPAPFRRQKPVPNAVRSCSSRRAARKWPWGRGSASRTANSPLRRRFQLQRASLGRLQSVAGPQPAPCGRRGVAEALCRRCCLSSCPCPSQGLRIALKVMEGRQVWRERGAAPC